MKTLMISLTVAGAMLATSTANAAVFRVGVGPVRVGVRTAPIRRAYVAPIRRAHVSPVVIRPIPRPMLAAPVLAPPLAPPVEVAPVMIPPAVAPVVAPVVNVVPPRRAARPVVIRHHVWHAIH